MSRSSFIGRMRDTTYGLWVKRGRSHLGMRCILGTAPRVPFGRISATNGIPRCQPPLPRTRPPGSPGHTSTFPDSHTDTAREEGPRRPRQTFGTEMRHLCLVRREELDSGPVHLLPPTYDTRDSPLPALRVDTSVSDPLNRDSRHTFPSLVWGPWAMPRGPKSWS